MRKFSRMHGTMELVGYASGDGSVTLRWAALGKAGSPSLPEIVTESDVSEWLNRPDVGSKWDGWDILNLGTDEAPRIVLARDVERPSYSSKKLVMGGKTYRYVFDKHDLGATEFFEGRSTRIVKNTTITTALCFFLNHEDAYCRRKVQRAG